MTTTATKLITADELLRLPRGYGKRYELIRGALIAKMPAGDPQGNAIARAGARILAYADETGYGAARSGEPGYRLERSPDTVRAPDAVFPPPARTPGATQFRESALSRRSFP